jgi:hypothetical protein
METLDRLIAALDATGAAAIGYSLGWTLVDELAFRPPRH